MGEQTKKINVIVSLQVEGIHKWEGINDLIDEGQKELSSVAFLQFPHRHMFHIEAKLRVCHSDRDQEIILLKRGILDYLSNNYGGGELEPDVMYFNNMSCEMIAEDLTEAFNLNYCKVLEDGENGAEIIIED